MNEHENVDEDAPHTRQCIKYSIRHSTLARSWKLKREWYRFKLVEVLMDSALNELKKGGAV